MTITVSGLYYYPVKGCGGVQARTKATIAKTGIFLDHWLMVVDEETGMFVAQRSDGDLGIGVRSMCLIQPFVVRDTLMLVAPGMKSLMLPLAGHNGSSMEVQIWNRRTSAIDQGDQVSEWLNTFLERERNGRYRLVRLPDDAETSFADADPFLFISEASLADLNKRLDQPLPMNRFRPNIILDGCPPYAEDKMKSVEIGGVTFFGERLCPRCLTTTTDQRTAERGPEPLRTLAKYRKRGNNVFFGRNFDHARQIGTIRVGDVCKVEWED